MRYHRRTSVKSIAMRHASWSTFRMVVVGLLTLAMLLVYAIPNHSTLVPHDRSLTQNESVVTATADQTVGEHDHHKAPCEDARFLDDSACCSMAQCATMHGGLPAEPVEAFIPHLDISSQLPVPAMPEGIGSCPALRPPRLII